MKSTHTKALRAQLRTLIVDDNDTNLRILERTLIHHFSHLVSCKDIIKANDGTQALESYAAHKFDLILLDIDMPTLSGVDVAKQIRETDADIIIIACTTSDSPSAREHYTVVGMDGCVSKPLDLREVDEALLQALHSRAHLDLYREGRTATRAPSKFRSHHGSLPAIALDPCLVVPTVPTCLSDSGLQDIHVEKSCYFQSLTQTALCMSKPGTAIDERDDESLNGSSTSSDISFADLRMRSYSSSSTDPLRVVSKRPRYETSSSFRALSEPDIYEFPPISVSSEVQST